MKVVALISGGKDSCYNMMQCVAAGHQIVALANLRPAENEKDELDSYMYQTVGHQAIDLYAEAMDLPLYRRTIVGTSLDIGREYSECDGDEVEDLYHLLKLVKEKEGVEGVSVGAILSDYQRIRVENVCKRLNLQPLAYLWRRNQEDLLREMISSNIQAMIIKVAAFGLDPDKHLGKTLDQMEVYLKQLSTQYGVHVCGEGGEYETFTLDCPLFKKKIVIDSSEAVIHSADAFAPVGYLRFLKMHVADKPNNSSASTTVTDSCPCMNYVGDITEFVENNEQKQTPQVQIASDLCRDTLWDYKRFCPLRTKHGYQWICGISGSSVHSERSSIQDQTKQVFTLLQGEVEARGFELNDMVLVHLYVKSMSDFCTINSLYQSYFDVNPPARVCVEAPLPDGELLQIDCLLYKCEITGDDTSSQQKQVMHVQSISHWAPANIGPYSQSIKVGEAIFCAGQIALMPCTMQLVQGGVRTEARLSFSHVEKVLDAMNTGLTLSHVLLANCYVTNKKNIGLVQKIWDNKLKEPSSKDEDYGEAERKCGPLVIAVVPHLPRGAEVELHVIAACDDPRQRKSSHMTKELTLGNIEYEVLESSSAASATISLSLSLPPSPDTPLNTEDIVKDLSGSFNEALHKLDENLSPLCFRAFYKQSSTAARLLLSGFVQSMKQSLDDSSSAVSLVPVEDLPFSRTLHITCWLSK
ncbi:diphthine--ammonia ligase-like [Huso huso]|uniref:Diphthine--ammonia ligase n=1 Tax=Huso huso TaxID=61971 RepID=A0ABR0Z2P8_HUSHU